MKQATRPRPESAALGRSIATPRRRTPPSSGHLRPLSLAPPRDGRHHRPVGGGNVHRRTPLTRSGGRDLALELPIRGSPPRRAGDRTTSCSVRYRRTAGVWWHASTLRLVSDMGHPARAEVEHSRGSTGRGIARALSAAEMRRKRHIEDAIGRRMPRISPRLIGRSRPALRRLHRGAPGHDATDCRALCVCPSVVGHRGGASDTPCSGESPCASCSARSCVVSRSQKRPRRRRVGPHRGGRRRSASRPMRSRSSSRRPPCVARPKIGWPRRLSVNGRGSWAGPGRSRRRRPRLRSVSSLRAS